MQCKIRFFLPIGNEYVWLEIMAQKFMMLWTQNNCTNILKQIVGKSFYLLKVFNNSSLTKTSKKLSFLFLKEFHHYYDVVHYEFIWSICFHLSLYNIFFLICTPINSSKDKTFCVWTHSLLHWPREAKLNFFFIRFSKVVKESPCN